jgi:glycosyltransferase involved in cell wall biosynthesis
MSIPDISLVVPVRQEAATLDRFLESIAALVPGPAEIVICDGGSTDASRDIVRRWAAVDPRIRLIEDADAYPGRARNLGIRAATHEWIALTDAGTIVPQDWLDRLIEARDRSGRADVVYGTYEPMLESPMQEAAALAFLAPARPEGDGYTRGPSTASMLMRRSVWDSVGGFPEHLRAAEDLVFFRGVARTDARCVAAPKAVVQWQLPSSVYAVFRRFRVFSRHTLRAGLGGGWHGAIVRMYLVALAAFVLAIVHSPWWLLAPGLGFAARACIGVRRRRPPAGPAIELRPEIVLLAMLLLLVIDAAMFVGLFEWARSWTKRYETT